MAPISLVALPAVVVFALAQVQTQAPPKRFEPFSGMPGKDVIWVPTPAEVVEKMLDIAKVTSEDVVMDLGSGDGRLVIAAARRGARAVGVEFNPDLVNLSRQRAKEAGVDGKASFLVGDMYQADISQASVMALFLLTANLDRLKDKLLALRPGSRIVVNTFQVTGWEPDETAAVVGDCTSWCTLLLYIVPARVSGSWRFGTGELHLTQEFQRVRGDLEAGGSKTAVTGRLKGEEITLSIGGADYNGRVTGDRMQGTFGKQRQAWTATRR
jgi:SAM-dependent methyltransferase